MGDNGRSIWPNWSISDLYHGQPKEVLESLCDPEICRYDRELGWKGLPWLFWTTEIYSFGRCYREWLKWPQWLPIPVYGDHSVGLDGVLERHETDNRAKYYLVFYSERFKALVNRREKQFIQVPHPWINHRRANNICLSLQARGTIVFFPHSIEGEDIEDYDFAEYFSWLKNLPDSFKPLVICMYMTDILKGYHNNILKQGIPIVTSGNTRSQYFVDRFYDLTRNFKYATSNSGGSELFYCVELGVNYFIYGKTPVYVNKAHEAPLGVQLPLDDLGFRSLKLKNEVFRGFPPTIDANKCRFTADGLGLNVDQSAARKNITQIFIIESLRLFPFYCSELLIPFFCNIRNKVLRFFSIMQNDGLLAALKRSMEKLIN